MPLICRELGKNPTAYLQLNCTNFISVDERLRYEPHPDQPHRTLLTQTTEVSMHGVPLVDYLESLVINTFSANANKVSEKRLSSNGSFFELCMWFKRFGVVSCENKN